MSQNQANCSTIDPRKLQQSESTYLIDVRTAPEFEEKHISDADLFPLQNLDTAQIMKNANGRTICLICQTGGRSHKAASKLSAAGLTDLLVLDGGLEAWDKAGLPLLRGKKGISLERQVRIAAGSIIVLGVVAGFLFHPGFFVIPGLAGAGLIFAGITDWCGMGLFLARMPWNRQRRSSCAVDHRI